MTPVSLPVEKPQPNTPIYPASALQLFDTFNSPDEFFKRFGVAPPAWDSTRRPKNWFDTSLDLSDPTSSVEYRVVHQVPKTGEWKVIVIAMSVLEASVLNLAPSAFPSGSPPLPPLWEVPIRALLPNERLHPTPFGAQIMRVDLQLAADEQAGKFTAHDRAVLVAIAGKLGVDPSTV